MIERLTASLGQLASPAPADLASAAAAQWRGDGAQDDSYRRRAPASER